MFHATEDAFPASGSARRIDTTDGGWVSTENVRTVLYALDVRSSDARTRQKYVPLGRAEPGVNEVTLRPDWLIAGELKSLLSSTWIW